MKKLLLLGAILSLSQSYVSADIKYDPTSLTFYSLPASPQVNCGEYNALVLQIALMQIQCWNSGVYGKKLRDQTSSYLKTLNTPTSLRLLSDLEKNWK